MRGLVSKNMGMKLFLSYLFIIYGIVAPISLSASNIVLGLIIISGIALLYIAKIDIRPRINARLVIFAVLLFFWGALTRLIHGSPLDGKAFENVWEYAPVILFPLFLSVIKVKKEAIVKALLISSSIVCFLGIIQYLMPSIVYPFPRQLIRGDFRGFFSHHLHTGGFYSMTTILAFSLALFWQCERKKKGTVWLFFFLNLIALFLSMARSYYISVFILLLILLAVKNWRWFAFGGVAFIGILVLLLSFPNSIESRIKTLTDPNFASNKERVYMWKAAIEMFKEHPIAGVGKGNWAKEARDNYFPRFKNEWPVFGAFAHAHNVYLTWLAETGIIGLTLFLSFWLSVAWSLFSGLSKVQGDSFEFSLIIGSLGSLGNLFIAGMFENNFGTSVVLLLITLLLGLSLNSSNTSEARES